jgi:ABC-2 type transport system permease protein
VAARIGSTVVIVGLMTIVVLALGATAYSVHIQAGTLPGLILTLILGTACFTTLGIGVTRFIGSAESAPVFVNLSILPLTFISNIWFPTDGMPHALKVIARLFPINALADGLQYAFDPRTAGVGLKAQDVWTLLIWIAVGIYLMVKFLRRPQGEVV